MQKGQHVVVHILLGIVRSQFLPGPAFQMVLQKIEEPPVFTLTIIVQEGILDKSIFVDEGLFRQN